MGYTFHSTRTTVERDSLSRFFVHDRIFIHQPPRAEEMPDSSPVGFV